ncbi:MAG: hypothetical protein LBK73_08435, partial [Treponema sp.]|nr:hypothetical protein [Treponema sp.]
NNLSHNSGATRNVGTFPATRSVDQQPKNKRGVLIWKMIRPRQNLEVPRQNLEVPRQNLEVPRQNLQVPRRNFEVPRQNLEVPRQNLQVPR